MASSRAEVSLLLRRDLVNGAISDIGVPAAGPQAVTLDPASFTSSDLHLDVVGNTHANKGLLLNSLPSLL